MNAGEFLNHKNWVVAGDVINKEKYASKILNRLQEKGYLVAGVHPKKQGENLYKSLKYIPFNVEVVDLCINSALGIEIVKEAKELNIDKVLIQPGAESEEIISYCKENGITAVEDCALVQLQKL
ncbi:CoA-binding protein [Haloimpatiens sp. FM7315]|uniref:CoA-binding protein n=1 Tax=Haloimpatiens sp. FM7315 TaxID=3298609 RepID=UPI0035A32C13